MQPCFNQRFARFEFAADTLPGTPFRSQRDQRCLRMLPILLLHRPLLRFQFFCIHHCFSFSCKAGPPSGVQTSVKLENSLSIRVGKRGEHLRRVHKAG